jgi:hypothetical protein
MQRLDPADSGAEYRNVIGIPGGRSNDLYDLIQKYNTYNMPVIDGEGGPDSDLEGEFVV